MGAELFVNGSTTNCEFLSLNPGDEPAMAGGEQRFTMLTRANHFELMSRPPGERADANPWPEWPRVFGVDFSDAIANELSGAKLVISQYF